MAYGPNSDSALTMGGYSHGWETRQGGSQYFNIMEISSRQQTQKCCQALWKHVMLYSQMPALCLAQAMLQNYCSKEKMGLCHPSLVMENLQDVQKILKNSYHAFL